MDCYDPESGQIYRETIIRPGKNDRPHVGLEHECAGEKPRKFLSRRGADKLTSMVLRKLVCNASQLEPETLKALPTQTAHQIRSAIRRQACETFYIWKNFAGSGHEDGTFRHATIIPSTLYKPYVNYFLDLNSPSFAWMVNLSLADIVCSPMELRQLSLINNLQTLTISCSPAQSQTQTPFDNDMLSHFAHKASNGGAFSRLKMIFISNCREITMTSLSYLSDFPALRTFCALGTKIKPNKVAQYQSNGWRSQADTNLMTYARSQSMPEIHGRNRTHFIPDFNELVETYLQKSRLDKQTEGDNLPSVDAYFGRKRVHLSAWVEIEDLVCLERDLNAVNLGVRKRSLAPPTLGPSNVVDGRRPMKKRKLKDGKAVSLDDVLGGF